METPQDEASDDEAAREAFKRERAERTLILNAPEELREIVEVIRKVVTKILQNPSEDKYRKLRASSKLLSSKVLSKKGGREAMTALGFTSVTDGVEASVVLERRDGETERLSDGLERTTTGSAVPSNDDDDKVSFSYYYVTAGLESLVAERVSGMRPLDATHCEVAVRLPSGARLEAAFKRDETVRDVLKFVEAVCGKRRSLALSTLRPPGPPLRLDSDEDLDSTLPEAGLAPRAALVAVDATGPSALSATEKAFDEARRKGLEEQRLQKRERDEVARKVRLDKLAKKKDAEQQRADALRHFDSDREAKSERVERGRRLLQLRKERGESTRIAEYPGTSNSTSTTQSQESSRHASSTTTSAAPSLPPPPPPPKDDDAAAGEDDDENY